MLRSIRALQSALEISDAQLLLLGRSVAGDPQLRCIEDMLNVDLADLETELLNIQFQAREARRLSAA